MPEARPAPGIIVTNPTTLVLLLPLPLETQACSWLVVMLVVNKNDQAIVNLLTR